jgi:ribosome maturation factor RimP
MGQLELAAKKVGPKPTFLFEEMEIRDQVIQLVEPILGDARLELVDVEHRREGHGQVLRLLVDRVGGEGNVDLESLSRLARELSDVLDGEDLIAGSYTLECSSPGIHRPLRTREHFERYLGKKVRVRSREPLAGQRNFSGTLDAVTAAGVTVRGEGGVESTIDFDNIEKANYEHEFSAADFAKRAVPR